MGQFAFMIHPLDVGSVTRQFPWARFLPDSLIGKLLDRLPPFKISDIDGIRSEHGSAHGHFIVCPVTSAQFKDLPEEKTIPRVVATGRLAERLGAGVVGLGAFTAVVGGSGQVVAEELDIAVTTGNSYTVATAIEGAKKAASFMGYRLDSITLAVVGATGSIGRVCSRMLAPEVGKLILVGRDYSTLAGLRRDMGSEIAAEVDISTEVHTALPEADVVITVSSAVDAIIQPEDLRPGAVVCDVARPRDVSEKVSSARDDVLVIEGGIVSVPGEPRWSLDFGTPEGTCMACMAETMILAMEERYENFTLGRNLRYEQVAEIDQLAKKHGFAVSGFRAFEKQLSDEKLESIRTRGREERVRLGFDVPM
ncbi:MAG: shikimate dehydrogenase [Bacillota bacterium]